MAILQYDAEFFSLSMSTRRGVTFVSLSGDVDHDSAAGLADAVELLRRRAPRQVFIDLAGVTFACSTLINFFARVVGALPPTSTVTLCRPTPKVVKLIRLASVETLTETRTDQPTEWPTFELTGPVPSPRRVGGAFDTGSRRKGPTSEPRLVGDPDARSYLTIETDPQGPWAQVLLGGELDMDNAGELRDCMQELVANGHVRLELNVRDLTFCDSRGLAEMLSAAESCRRAGGDLTVTESTGAVRRVMALTGVDTLLCGSAAERRAASTEPGPSRHETGHH